MSSDITSTQLARALAVLHEIAAQDYRGPRPADATKAENALYEIAGCDCHKRSCPACGAAVHKRGNHYVPSVGHMTDPESAITPYWHCTGETAWAVRQRQVPK